MSEYAKIEHPVETEFPYLDIDHILRKVRERSKDSSGPSFIAVGGASAAGKSTMSSYLAGIIPEAQTFSIDAYLSEGLWDPSKVYNHEPPDPSRPYIGGISPAIWDFDLMERHLKQLKLGLPISMPLFDETIKDRVGYQPFVPSSIILFEGGHSFSDQFRDISTYRILVKASFHDRLTRKITRTHCLYGRDDVDEVIHRYLTKDEPVRRVYEEEHVSIADQIVNNPARPEVDYSGFSVTAGSSSNGTYRALIPKPDVGELKQGEALGVVEGKGTFYVYYVADNRTLVNLPISLETTELLSLYYDIK